MFRFIQIARVIDNTVYVANVFHDLMILYISVSISVQDRDTCDQLASGDRRLSGEHADFIQEFL